MIDRVIDHVARRGRWVIVMALLALALPALAVTASATEAKHPGVARVSYRTPSTIYIDGGSSAGLSVGDSVTVYRGGRPFVRLRVDYTSSRRSACHLPTDALEIAVGDEVRFTPTAAIDAPAAATQLPEGLGRSSGAATRFVDDWRQRGRTRGRVGVRMLAVQQRTGTGTDLTQPALDLRIDAREIAGSRFDARIDARARHTWRNLSDGAREDEGRNRVYRLSASWKATERAPRISLGRQYSSQLAPISVYDGVAVSLERERFTAGILSGTQPDPADYAFANDVREHGVFAQLHNRQGDPRRWAATLGLIGSYEDGEINREFAYLQGRYGDRRAAIYLAQEIDLNRGWKREMGESSASLTSTHATARWRVHERVDIHTGADSRRSVRLFRNRETPETEFDDTYRQGFWGGVGTRLVRVVRVGASARHSTGGSAGAANSYSLNASTQQLAGQPVDLRTRATFYTNDRLDGWLISSALGLSMIERLRLELNGGLRRESLRIGFDEDTDQAWYGMAAEWNLDRHWYLSLSAERSEDGNDAHDQIYGSTSYRF